jgi:glycosyltransferase involved in cell wall biosynthesis
MIIVKHNTPYFSLIVTSQGERRDLFRRFLESLRDQLFKDFELIFIDQTDGQYNSMLEKFKSIFVNIIASDKIRLSEARNIGLKVARGKVIGFPDDDCFYHSFVLEQAKKIIENDKKIVGVNGKALDPWSMKPYGKRKYPRTRREISTFNVFSIASSISIFLMKDTIDLVGGFNKDLGAGSLYGGSEETDLLLKIIKTNKKIVYNPNIIIYHENLKNYTEPDINKYYHYSIGFGFVVARALKNSQSGVIYYFLNILLRSLVGNVFYIFNRIKRKVYYKRFKGLVKGFIIGIKK